MRALLLASVFTLGVGGAALAQSSPEVGVAGDLHAAKLALGAHERAKADTDLQNAETLLLTRSVVAGAAHTPDHGPAVHAIEQARQALAGGDFAAARHNTDQALDIVTARHGTMQRPLMRMAAPAGSPTPSATVQGTGAGSGSR